MTMVKSIDANFGWTISLSKYFTRKTCNFPHLCLSQSEQLLQGSPAHMGNLPHTVYSEHVHGYDSVNEKNMTVWLTKQS